MDLTIWDGDAAGTKTGVTPILCPLTLKIIEEEGISRFVGLPDLKDMRLIDVHRK
jgi:hypothetical protein